MISKPGRQLEHRYQLANASSRDVKIVEVINRKACCGVVRIGSQLLHPGEATGLDVTLVVGEKFGAIVHETELVTDLPGNSSIILRTSAVGRPAIRVEEVSSPMGPLLLGKSEARRSEFRVFAAGTATEKPFDLARVDLASTIPVAWCGPKEAGLGEDDTTGETRRFVATFDSSGPVGDRRAEVLFRDGNDILLRHSLSWEITEPIVATPKVVVMKPDGHGLRVSLRSLDGSKFRVTRVECDAPEIKAKASNDPASTRIIEVEGFMKTPAQGRGVIRITTDHADRATIDLPYLVLD